MLKTKNYIILIILIVAVLICTIMFTSKINKLEECLEVTEVNLQLKEDALLDTQEELVLTQEKIQIETEKSAGLSEKLGTMMYELDELNGMLNILKSEEYNVVYIGDFKYTYYCDERYPHICGYGMGLTASGASTEVGTTVAVDPTIIPLGSTVYIEGIGLRVAQDTGGAIKGNKIDILMNTHNECFEQTIINGGVWIVSQKTP